MKKEELLAAIADLREGWDDVISRLGPDGLERPGATGDWRVRDVLAHCNAWERWQLVQLRCAFTDETPSDDELTGGIKYPDSESMQEDAMNAMFIAGTKDLPLQTILDHWREVTDMRERWVGDATDEQLDETFAADWASGSDRVFRLTSEAPDLPNPRRVWEQLSEQLDHQRYHLAIVREWMASAN
jgi:hypothetical protein